MLANFCCHATSRQLGLAILAGIVVCPLLAAGVEATLGASAPLYEGRSVASVPQLRPVLVNPPGPSPVD